MTVYENIETPLIYKGLKSSIARAIFGKPQLLLADEPTGNLHSNQGREIMKVLRQLNEEGITIIQVTHNEEFAQMGKRIIRIADGRKEGKR
jgi:putative ABC transport system ATP-binding protein